MASSPTPTKYILGIDMGTTSVKVVLLDSHLRKVTDACSLPTTANTSNRDGKVMEQDSGKIVDTLNQCMTSLPRDKLRNVTRIGVSGQMHGVMFWKTKTGLEQLCSKWHGIPVGTSVGVALGDFQCAVYSCMVDRTDAVLNISTSAQLSFAMPAEFRPPRVPDPSSLVSYFPYFDGVFLVVAASLNGGNAVATFVDMLTAWMKELGVEISSSSIYSQMIEAGLNQNSSDLKVRPTILGERHDTSCLGLVSNISASNVSLGHLTRALCQGIVENIAAMLPPQLLLESGVKRIVGSGSALIRNEVLRQEAERAFPFPVQYSEDADSAVGVAMILSDMM